MTTPESFHDVTTPRENLSWLYHQQFPVKPSISQWTQSIIFHTDVSTFRVWERLSDIGEQQCCRRADTVIDLLVDCQCYALYMWHVFVWLRKLRVWHHTYTLIHVHPHTRTPPYTYTPIHVHPHTRTLPNPYILLLLQLYWWFLH